MATAKHSAQVEATFAMVGRGQVQVNRDPGDSTVAITTDNGLVLALQVDVARTLAQRLLEACDR